MTTTVGSKGRRVNGLDPKSVETAREQIARDPASGTVEFRVRSEWRGQMRSRTAVESYTIGGQTVHRHFTIDVDEPFELLGRNTAPNPQELLLASLSACLIVGYATGAALRGITLETIEIEASGVLDLRGFFGLDAAVSPGYETIRCAVRVKGDGTRAQLQEIHEAVRRASPNYGTLTSPVRIDAELLVE
jgi:uncharacterized OsmC-like protein